jgi:hypothetical protein
MLGVCLGLSAIDDAEMVLIGLAEACAAQGATPSDLAMAIGPAVLRTWHAMRD